MFGGIPYYNRLISVKKSVRENIIDLIASPGARLENEVSMYLNSEISKITNAKKAPINDENNRKKIQDISFPIIGLCSIINIFSETCVSFNSL